MPLSHVTVCSCPVAFAADAKLRAEAAEAAKEAASDAKVYEGRVCSGDQFISATEQKERITTDLS